MNRNNEAHFNQIPKTYVSRSRFKRDQNVKLTFDAGKLIPFYVDEVLPGDTFSVDTIGLVRMTTPIVPVMDNCYLDVYYFFVPNRIVWDNWKEFCVFRPFSGFFGAVFVVTEPAFKVRKIRSIA
jgi:hypothetical protein